MLAAKAPKFSICPVLVTVVCSLLAYNTCDYSDDDDDDGALDLECW